MAKTIKQIADEIGVTKQAVHQKRKSKALSTILQPFTTTVDGVIYISVDGEKLIKKSFLREDCKRVYDSFTETNDSLFTQKTDIYEILKRELEEKNKQIKELTDELAKEREHSRKQSEKIVALADQSQQLQLAQMNSTLNNESELENKEKQIEKNKQNLKKIFGLDEEEIEIQNDKKWYEFWKKL